MTLDIYTELRNDIESRLSIVQNKLNSFPKSASGMVQQSVDLSNANKAFYLVFNQLRALNKVTSNKVKKQHSRNKRGY